MEIKFYEKIGNDSIMMPEEIEVISILVPKTAENIVFDCAKMRYTTTASWNRLLSNIYDNWGSKNKMKKHIKIINTTPLIEFSFKSAWEIVEQKHGK